jgi:membrane fusion protein (multidrug efflux system)
MGMAMRALSGILITIVTCGLLGLAAWNLYASITAASGKRQPPSRERTYAVDTATLETATVQPLITAYGQVHAWNTLEIRAPAQGAIFDLSPSFRDGMTVEAGELLFRIEPETLERRVVDAKAAVAQARSELAETTAALAHLKSEVATAKAQVAVRRSDLERKSTLRARRLVTATVLDEVVLALSAAEQSVTAKEQALLAGESRIVLATHNVERAEISLADAKKSRADANYRAPYSGRLDGVAATLGERVSQNEKLATLIDPNALEVSLRLRPHEFARVLPTHGTRQLAPLSITAVLDLHDRTVEVSGVLDRPAAVSNASQGGRIVFAKLSDAGNTPMRPGDFVTVYVKEPALQNVAVIPSQAATEDGRILLVGADNRLTEAKANILRRQNDELIVDGVPFGSRYVTRRLPYLAAGVKVEPRSKPGSPSTRVSAHSEGRSLEMVALSHERRSALIAYLKSNTSMPAARRERAIKALGEPKAPRTLIERLERQIARNEGRT